MRKARYAAIAAAAVCGAAQWLFLDEAALFYGSALVLACIGVYWLQGFLYRVSKLTTYDLIVGVTCLAYGIGTLNTSIRFGLEGIDIVNSSMAPAYYMSQAMAGVLLAIGLLLLVAELDSRPVFFDFAIPANYHGIVLLVVGGSLFVCLLLIATGQLGFQLGVRAEGDELRVSPLAALAVATLAPGAAISSYCGAISQRGKRGLFLVLSCLSLLILLTQGRRLFVFGILLCGMTFFLARPSWRPHLRQVIPTVLIAAVVIFAGSRIFYALRLANNELMGNGSLVELVAKGYQGFVEGDRGELNAQTTENEKVRTYVIEYLGELLFHTTTRTPLHGELASFALAAAVPSSLWKGKDQFVGEVTEEGVVHPRLGMPIWDGPNTIYTAGVSDFGIIGMFVYPVLLALAYGLCIKFARCLDPLSRAYFVLSIVYILLGVELSMSTMFTGVRDAAIIAVLVHIFGAMYRWASGHKSEPVVSS